MSFLAPFFVVLVIGFSGWPGSVFSTDNKSDNSSGLNADPEVVEADNQGAGQKPSDAPKQGDVTPKAEETAPGTKPAKKKQQGAPAATGPRMRQDNETINQFIDSVVKDVIKQVNPDTTPKD